MTAFPSVSHRQAVDQIINAIRHSDADGYARLFAEEAVLEHPLLPEPLNGRAAIREGEQALFDSFSDVEVELRLVAGDENSVVAEVVLRATNTGPIDLGEGEPVPATGRRIEVPAVWIFDFGPDGLVTAERDYFDTASMMAQLGLGS